MHFYPANPYFIDGMRGFQEKIVEGWEISNEMTFISSVCTILFYSKTLFYAEMNQYVKTVKTVIIIALLYV